MEHCYPWDCVGESNRIVLRFYQRKSEEKNVLLSGILAIVWLF